MGAPAASPCRILALNPGSTSTKIALFEDERGVFSENLPHPAGELAAYARVADQLPFRRIAVEASLARAGPAGAGLHAVVGRGGLLRPVEGGTYAVNGRMLAELRSGAHGEHASNLGALLAAAFAEPAGLPAYIVDPVVVDELDGVARLTGLPELTRRSIFHALNQKAVARSAAESLGRPYDSVNLVVAHLGGGISVGAHRNGRVIDVNNALDGDGPMAPERAGTLPAGQLAELCCSGRWTLAEVKRKLTGSGGMVAHLGTNDLREARSRAETGDAAAADVLSAMAYGVAKQIGAMASALAGRVDAVVLTGGLAADKDFAADVSGRVGWIAQVIVIPGEREMLSLAQGALRVLRGRETAKIY